MKRKIMQLLCWTELEYAQFQYESGLKYLRTYIPGDEAGIYALERSRIFWSWWKNHWAQRDAQYVANINEANSVARMREYYIWFNDPEYLIKTIYPNAIVLHDSYARMIDEFNKAEVANG